MGNLCGIHISLILKSTWLLPYKFVIPNKLRELHYKIVHNIYPINKYISRFVVLDDKCEMCKIEEEIPKHIFYDCQYTLGFWRKIEDFLNIQTNHSIKLEANDVILYHENKNKKNHQSVNLFILLGNFHIHKNKFSRSHTSFDPYMIELRMYYKSIQIIDNKK